MTTKSDTHLPRLSRTTSQTSNSSHHSASRPKDSRKRSEESIEVLDSQGRALASPAEEEGWESGEGGNDVDQLVIPSRNHSRTATPKNGQSRTGSPSSTMMRRSKSDGHEGSRSAPRPQQPQRLRGFEAEHSHVGSPTVGTPKDHWGIHQHHSHTSWKEVNGNHRPCSDPPLADPPLAEPPLAEPSVSNSKPSRAGELKNEKAQPDVRRTNSTGGSGATGLAAAENELSPPRFPISEGKPTQLMHDEHSATRPTTTPQSQLIYPTAIEAGSSTSRLSAAPASLHSPLHRRRLPSLLNSPDKHRRLPSFQITPAAPPVVYRETVNGRGWDVTEEDSEAGPAGEPSSFASASTMANGSRLPSSSSSRSLHSIGSVKEGSSPRSRRSAFQAASALSRLPSTNDAALYYQSLGYPSSAAETAHLISRFLPPKRVRRPAWEITPQEVNEGTSRIGLTTSEYREAHESLVRSMKEMALPPTGSVGRKVSRSTSLLGLAAKANSVKQETGPTLGFVPGRDGLVVARGGWRGKTLSS